MADPVVEAACNPFGGHDWDEGYYGYTCKRCRTFIPYGSEPWVDYSDDDKAEMDRKRAAELDGQSEGCR